uniref:Uncharacterized protein n=1 Tax=Arundo donax TaxID=35708 RepID=A0A0A9BUY8_ARUDO
MGSDLELIVFMIFSQNYSYDLL